MGKAFSSHALWEFTPLSSSHLSLRFHRGANYPSAALSAGRIKCSSSRKADIPPETQWSANMGSGSGTLCHTLYTGALTHSVFSEWERNFLANEGFPEECLQKLIHI